VCIASEARDIQTIVLLVVFAGVGWIVGWLIVGNWLDNLTGRGPACTWLCVLFGPIGLIAALLLPWTPEAEARRRVAIKLAAEAELRAIAEGKRIREQREAEAKAGEEERRAAARRIAVQATELTREEGAEKQR
jgi:hypothetical protein